MIVAAEQVNHYVAISKQYYRQPQNNDMKNITNYMKNNAQAERMTLERLLNQLSNGHNAIISNYEVYYKKSDYKKLIRFVSSSLIMIDIDDDEKITDPQKILDDLSNYCAGLFYTWSHEIKGNRYRLVFQLDEQITNELDYQTLVDYILLDLNLKGLPVDDVASRPTEIVRGGNSGYLINSIDTFIKVADWLPKAKEFYKERLERIENNRQRAITENMNNPVTYEQLHEMCTLIGHIPSGEGSEMTQKWLQITYAIKNCVNMEMIDNEQGYNLFNIVSGGESNEYQWNSTKSRGDVSVATIIHYAQEKGYVHNSYSRSLQDVPEPIEIETISNKTYINTDTMIDLISRKQKLLVESPTGSGKTTATMKAFKQLVNDSYAFYIFAAPTIVLAEQIAIDHDVTCIKGGISRFYNTVKGKVMQGERVFISTYDKTSELISYINQISNYQAKHHVVVDEIHKYTEAYNYRFVSIDRLEDISNKATSFLGLTGTPEDVLKTSFNKMIKINTGNEKSPLSDFRVFTYDKLNTTTNVVDSANILLVSVIRSVLEQSRLIVFINSKERIRTVSRLLDKENIKYATVTSDKKQSITYKDIVTSGTIDDNTQVVLTTTVLSDGITIKNDLEWSCLVVSDRNSPIFNPSTIKQISNRFRNQYRYFLMFMRTPNKKYNDTRRFNMESDYSYRLGVANNYVSYLNKTYKNNFNNFIAATVEKQNGIYYKSLDNVAKIKYNPLFLRHNAMKEKENYYKTYRKAFIKEISRLIGSESTGTFNVNEELRANGTDLSNLLTEVAEEKEEVQLTNEELRKNFTEFFTKDVYLAIKHADDQATINYFTSNVHSDNVSATFRNVKITDYEACFIIGQSVRRRADIRVYTNDIEALTHIAVFHQVKKVTVTKAIYLKLLKYAGKLITVSDFKQITKDLSKKVKINKRYVTQKDVKGVLKMFSKKFSESNGSSFTTLEPLTIESVAEKHGIEKKQVKESIIKYIKTQPIQRQKLMFEAVKKEYGITL